MRSLADAQGSGQQARPRFPPSSLWPSGPGRAGRPRFSLEYSTCAQFFFADKPCAQCLDTGTHAPAWTAPQGDGGRWRPAPSPAAPLPRPRSWGERTWSVRGHGSSLPLPSRPERESLTQRRLRVPRPSAPTPRVRTDGFAGRGRKREEGGGARGRQTSGRTDLRSPRRPQSPLGTYSVQSPNQRPGPASSSPIRLPSLTVVAVMRHKTRDTALRAPPRRSEAQRVAMSLACASRGGALGHAANGVFDWRAESSVGVAGW